MPEKGVNTIVHQKLNKRYVPLKGKEICKDPGPSKMVEHSKSNGFMEKGVNLQNQA